MGRPAQRVRLESGLRLDLNRLRRIGLALEPGRTSWKSISWSYPYTGETVARAMVTAKLTDTIEGVLKVEVGSLDQTLLLFSQPRHFGGRQWYFACPTTGRLASVVWMPPGASRFASRHAWPRRVGYGSQFEGRHSRAMTAAQELRRRLGGPDWAGIDELDPPKPKWMRWATYRRLIQRSRAYERIADERLFILAARWEALG